MDFVTAAEGALGMKNPITVDPLRIDLTGEDAEVRALVAAFHASSHGRETPQSNRSRARQARMTEPMSAEPPAQMTWRDFEDIQDLHNSN